MAGKRQGFVGESELFYFFVKALTTIKPRFFIFENVPMLKDYISEISRNLDSFPVIIDSADLSAQTRKRLYWCNFNIPQISGQADTVRDILETDGVPFNYSSSGRGNGVVQDRLNPASKALTLTKTGYTKRAFTGVFDPKTLSSRPLTIIELERLQGLPDGYTDCVSMNQRKMAIGNGWNVQTICHILKGIKP